MLDCAMKLQNTILPKMIDDILDILLEENLPAHFVGVRVRSLVGMYLEDQENPLESFSELVRTIQTRYCEAVL